MIFELLLSLSLVFLQAPPGPVVSGTKSADFDTFRLGNAADISTKPTGGLLLAGGGTDQPDAFVWLLKHANGGDVLVIRASGTDAYNPFIAKLGTANSVETIVFKNRAASSNPSVLDRLARAEAIFLAGGDQGNYIKYWKDTPVEDAINAAAKRGVPIGGTSAGLAVLSQFSFAALNDTIVSKDALANPYDAKVSIERDFLDLPHMKGIITDSHWVERDRLGRTLVFMARLLEDGFASPARSISIDSTTAVLMELDGTATVVGKTAAYFLQAAKKPAVCRPGVPLTMESILVYRVQPGGRFDIKNWKNGTGLAYTLSVEKGVITSSRTDVY
jgi:cyanophycinase